MDLKPCPWCGGMPKLQKCVTVFEVVCYADGCPAYVQTRLYNTEREAIEAWNRRAVPDAGGKVLDLKEIQNLFCDIVQLFDGWHEDDAESWTEWDTSVRNRISKMQSNLAATGAEQLKAGGK